MSEQANVGGGSILAATPHVELRDITKTYGATQAVSGVSLVLRRGSVLGLVGENGAGKSTLAKILAGVVAPDSGEIVIDGKAVALDSPRDALASGIALMAQEISLVPEATVEENVLLGSLPSRGFVLRRRLLRERFEAVRKLAGFDLPPGARVGTLRLADQQKVELLRALSTNSQIIIMDEPSAALSSEELEGLHASIRHVVESGSTVVLISHFLEEVLALADEVAIMRDGSLIRTGPANAETVETLVSGMVGSELAIDYENRVALPRGSAVLSARGLTSQGKFSDVDLDVHEGEIVGLAGLVGAGRSELARALFGADPFDSGTIHLQGKNFRPKSPKVALRARVFMVPESRKDQGLVMTASVADNLALPNYDSVTRTGLVDGRGLKARALEVAKRVGLRFSSLTQSVQSLSGGNQQKVLFGRAQWADPRLLIVDEPTRGVDIAAKRSIHADLEDAAAKGAGVLFISSELDEVAGVCTRILVMWRGTIIGQFSPPYDKASLVRALFGEVDSER